MPHLSTLLALAIGETLGVRGARDAGANRAFAGLTDEFAGALVPLPLLERVVLR